MNVATFDIRDAGPRIGAERTRVVVGIDPGLTGAIAWCWPATPAMIRADDMPRVGKEVDGAQLAAWLREMRPEHAFVELANARPAKNDENGSQRGQGASSAFTTGANFGVIKGVLAAVGIPYTLVSSAKWKRDLRLSADKEQSRGAAIRTWPEAACFRRKKDHGRAEAALLARWGSYQRQAELA